MAEKSKCIDEIEFEKIIENLQNIFGFPLEFNSWQNFSFVNEIDTLQDKNSFQADTDNETEATEIISDDSLFIVPHPPVKKETYEKEFQTGLSVLQEMDDKVLNKEPKTEPLDITPKIEPKEEIEDIDFSNTGDFFEEWNEITPQLHIRKFKELTA